MIVGAGIIEMIAETPRPSMQLHLVKTEDSLKPADLVGKLIALLEDPRVVGVV